MKSAVKILLIGFGNPARADDGLGPALAGIIESKNIPGVAVEADYQLAVEDSFAIAENDIVIFADASTNAAEPFIFQPVEAEFNGNFSTHSIEPAGIMALAENLFGSKTKGYILGIRGYEFDSFSEGLTDKAKANLQKAVCFLEKLLKSKTSVFSVNSVANYFFLCGEKLVSFFLLNVLREIISLICVIRD